MVLPPPLSAANLDIAVQLAELPDQIRGYGHVKALSMEQAAHSRTGCRDTRLGRRRGVARRSLEPAARACRDFSRQPVRGAGRRDEWASFPVAGDCHASPVRQTLFATAPVTGAVPLLAAHAAMRDAATGAGMPAAMAPEASMTRRDVFTDGARRGRFDVYAEGARQVAGLDRSGVSSDPARHPDVYSDGARRGRFDVYAEGARQVAGLDRSGVSSDPARHPDVCTATAPRPAL